MRLTITLSAPGKVILPIHHNHLIQAAIYELIEQPGLRQFLHEEGFALGNRRFRLFTFSRLLGRIKVDRANGQMLFHPPLQLVICSPLDLLLREFGNTLLRRGMIRLGQARLEVESIAVKENAVRAGQVTVRMLSPLVTYSTLEQDHRHYTYYYSPFEPRFGELVTANLTKKYILIHGRPVAENGFRISPATVGPRDMKVVKYEAIVIKGWMGTYHLSGDPQLLEVALDAGLGAKNPQGFGCCEIARESEDDHVY